MAESARIPETEENLLGELSSFARDEAEGLRALAERIRSLSPPAVGEEIDVDAIWAAVERAIDLGPSDQTGAGRSEKG